MGEAPVTTVAQALAVATATLKAANIESARLDARALLADALAVEPMRLFSYPERLLSAEEAAAFAALIERRTRREPVSHILGRREFWSLDFRVSADTLDPRPDTETVVEAVLKRLPVRSAPLRLLDLGTGTGCILLALLHELPNATGVGVDASPGACAVAADNASRLGLAERSRVVCGDWGSSLDGSFDVIVSNPPYIPTDDIAALAPEVSRHEPAAALAGGADGLDCYRALAPQIARLLAPGGLAAVEVGQSQTAQVLDILEAAGLASAGVEPDLSGIDRCVLVRQPGGMA